MFNAFLFVAILFSSLVASSNSFASTHFLSEKPRGYTLESTKYITNGSEVSLRLTWAVYDIRCNLPIYAEFQFPCLDSVVETIKVADLTLVNSEMVFVARDGSESVCATVETKRNRRGKEKSYLVFTGKCSVVTTRSSRRVSAFLKVN
jgi:hypothetical protein